MHLGVKSGLMRLTAGFPLLIACSAASGQAARLASEMAKQASSEHSAPAPASSVQPLPQSSQQIVREIDDRQNGVRWLLMRDLNHPGGPGVMVAAGTESIGSPLELHQEIEQRRHEGEKIGLVLTPAKPVSAPVVPVIHSGDHVILEEDSAVVEARLEATALGPAVVGSPLEVRVKIGGKVVHAIALGSGRAALQPESEARQ
jgi:hypothetical protein